MFKEMRNFGLIISVFYCVVPACREGDMQGLMCSTIIIKSNSLIQLLTFTSLPTLAEVGRHIAAAREESLCLPALTDTK